MSANHILDACPFLCTGDVKIKYRPKDRAFYVECKFCGARGPIADSPEFAISWWNRRLYTKSSLREIDHG